jgi:hypothetical protein
MQSSCAPSISPVAPHDAVEDGLGYQQQKERWNRVPNKIVHRGWCLNALADSVKELWRDRKHSRLTFTKVRSLADFTGLQRFLFNISPIHAIRI